MDEPDISADTLVNYVSGQIFSGPDDPIWDDIWDWIANGVSTVVSTVTGFVGEVWNSITNTFTTWISWLWNAITSWFKPFWDWIGNLFTWLWGKITAWFEPFWTWVGELFTGLWQSVSTWFTTTWSWFGDLFSSWGEQIWEWLSNIGTAVSAGFQSFSLQLEAWFTWLVDTVREQVVTPMAEWWGGFLDKLFTPSEWIGQLLDAVVGWFTEDVPGHSIRWTGIFESIADWFVKWFVKFPQYMAENIPERVAYGLSESFRWLGDTFNEVFETFSDAIIGMARQLGPMTPGNAVTGFSSMSKVGLAALGGLAGMTVAGEFLNPLSHLGLGHISAMIYDMTNYKLITGAFMGAVTASMLRTPLTYYFNDIFRPWLLRQGDFMELMARGAFTEPEKLRVPELTTTIAAVTGGRGRGFENSMIGYYGFPGNYYGFFKELSFAPLRYFPLAGIARTGFYDEPWFVEALSRSGYSPTAKAALLAMFREQVLMARQLPVMSQVRRLNREGYSSLAQVQEILDKTSKLETLSECRLYAMELEREFHKKEAVLDISLRTFSRGIITESETRASLAGLGIPGDLIDLHLTREKLGLLRRISIPREEILAPLEFAEE